MKSFVLISFYFLLLLPNKLLSQVCTGSLGDPVVNIDFGSGTTPFGLALPAGVTNYIYTASAEPSDGLYTIVKRIGGGFGGAWFAAENHTPNDPDGYMMMVNASLDPGIFYEKTVDKELCPNTTYEFAAWIINLMKAESNRPNLTFSILTLDNQVLKTYNTGDIPESATATWKQYGFLFTTTGVSKVKIRITNNGKGGYGNDLALDDITFRACGPKMSTAIDQISATEKQICIGTGLDLSVNVAGSPTLQYLWQKNNGTGWIDLPAERTTKLKLNPADLPLGSHQYRLMAAEATNFNAPACRTASAVMTVEVRPLPKPAVVSPQVVCLGSSVKLDVTGTEGTYLWSGPNGFSSTEKSPVIENAGFNRSGIYKVTVTANGCEGTAQIEVQVKASPVAKVDKTDVSICEDALGVKLNASGGTVYKWLPEEGLSAADVADPLASPKQTTLYKVAVSNGGCTDTARVVVTVFKKISVSAGSNKVIIEGQSTVLDGKVTGDRFRYLWTPSDYLDDPAKQNPVATPPHDMAYVLNVWSEEGCFGGTSGMKVKVYKKLIIPNAFTPNGDGNNEVWHIEALEAYPDAEIKVFNRYGEKIFSSSADQKEWDGKYKSSDVPVGTYYYIIELHNGKKPVSGSVTILR